MASGAAPPSAVPGYFGKVACRGDFVSRGLSDAFVGAWDGWLAGRMHELPGLLGDAWLDVYLTSPIIRFVLPRAVLGWPVVGLLMPSVDRVGRYYPLVVASELPADAPALALALRSGAWFERLESTALGTLADDALTLEGLADGLAALPLRDSPAAAAGEGAEQMLAALAARDGAGPARSALWWVAQSLRFCFADPFPDTRTLAWLMGAGSGRERREPGAGGSGTDTPADAAAGAGEAVQVQHVDLASLVAAPAVPLPTVPGVPLPAAEAPAAPRADSRTVAAAAGRTEIGRVRSENQDAILTDRNRGLFAVADGMGGHLDGARASRMLVDALAGCDLHPPFESRIAAVRRVIEAVNQELYEFGVEAGGICGATVVVLLLAEGRFAVLWAGDSRAYRLGAGGDAEPLTVDHDNPEGGVSRACGAAPAIEIDVREGPVRPGDRFLLCSDGVYRHLDVAHFLLGRRTLTAGAVADAAVAEVLQTPAADNLSVVIADASA